MKHNLVKEYQNIKIRKIEKNDLELLRKWRNDKNNCKYLSTIPYITKEMQERWYENSKLSNGEYVFAIEEICELNRCVGSLAIYNIENNKAELGKILIGDKEAHGKKIGVHSIKALLILCFDYFNFKEVYLHVYKENIAALKVYTEVGFKIINEKNTELGIECEMSINKI